MISYKNVIKQSDADNQNLGVAGGTALVGHSLSHSRLVKVSSASFPGIWEKWNKHVCAPPLPCQKNNKITIVLYVSHLKIAIFSLREHLELTPAIFRLTVPRTNLARRFTWGVLCLTNIYQLITDMWIPSWQKMGATNFPGKMGSTINIRNIFKKLVAPQKLSWRYPWSSATWRICEKTKDGVSWEVIANSLTPYLNKERSVFFTVLFWSWRVTLKVENLHETLWGHYEIYSCSHTPCVRSLLYHWEPFKETYQQKLPWSTTMKVQKHVLQIKCHHKIENEIIWDPFFAGLPVVEAFNTWTLTQPFRSGPQVSNLQSSTTISTKSAFETDSCHGLRIKIRKGLLVYPRKQKTGWKMIWHNKWVNLS